MTRFASITALAFALGLGATGCEKPTEDACKQAIENMRRLMGTENLSDNNRLQGEVRRCKGGSTKKAVDCAIKATTYDELRACGFAKLPVTPGGDTGSGSASGSATGSTGSATGSGSAAGSDSAAGSAAGSGSAPGSAAGSATGSATGSGSAAGSAAGSGSATGSAAGSAGSATK